VGSCEVVEGQAFSEALSRGAAIAFYAITRSVLLIVIAIAGPAFGQDAAENAIKTTQRADFGRSGCPDVARIPHLPVTSTLRCSAIQRPVASCWNMALSSRRAAR
jgi:hypothetical protein